MKQRSALVLAITGLFVFGLAFSAVQAQDKHRSRNHIRIDCNGDWSGLDKDDLKALRILESLTDMKIRIHGLKDLEKLDKLDKPANFRIDIDLDGLGETIRELGRLGERIGKNLARHFDSHEFRKAMKALEKLKIDIDIDDDWDF
jgi:hypothetical protein